MTSIPRGPVPRPRGRGSGARAVVTEERLDRPARGEPADHEASGHAERQTQRRSQPLLPPAEQALRAALAAAGTSRSAVRYRGFVLLPQADLGWLVRPERSPMTVLPFRTPPISLSDVKALVDWRLDGAPLTAQPQHRQGR